LPGIGKVAGATSPGLTLRFRSLPEHRGWCAPQDL